MQNRQLFKLIINNIITAFAILAIAVVLCIIGHDTNEYRHVLCGVTLFWIYGMVYGVLNISELYGYTIMNFMIFVFFLSRPIIAIFYDTEWTTWNDGIVEKALLLVLISEVALFLGSHVAKQAPRADSLEINRTSNYNEIVQITLLMIVVITGLLCTYSSVKFYLRYVNLSYESMYLSGATLDNPLVRAAVTMFPFAVFSYLATIPSKRNSLGVLGVYVVLGVPSFLLGNRTSLVLRIAFATIYFFIRDYTDGDYRERWIKRSTKIGFIVFVAFSVVFLGAFNYYRSGLNPADLTSIPIFWDFFYRQGTTFDTVCQGLQYKEAIMKLPHTASYSIGPIYDTVKHSTLSQAIFNTKGLGSGNSMTMVLNSNSLAHKLSYIVLGKDTYLAGYGRGSSYLLETFYDGGELLLILFSFFIGFYLASINRLCYKRNWFINTLVITTLSKIFYIPRDSALDFFSFLFTPHFWLIMVSVVFAMFIIDFKNCITEYKRDLIKNERGIIDRVLEG